MDHHHESHNENCPQTPSSRQQSPLDAPERVPNNRTSHYHNTSAHDQARQHNGDNHYYGNVTFQHTIAAPVAALLAPNHEYIDFMETLKFAQMDSRYMTVQSQLLGTCEWLLRTPEYKSWLDPGLMSAHYGLLWIKGKAGAGKSTIMKFASENAEARCSSREHVLAFFFSARAGSLEISLEGLFRSLLYQLLNRIPGLYSMLDKRRLDLIKRQGWSSVLLKDTFEDAVLKLTENSVTCFIDAMDECRAEDVQEIIDYFDNLGDSVSAHPGRLRVCLSSRIYPNLKSIRSVELVLEKQTGHERDIQMYIERRLVLDSKHLEKDLAEAIENKARGVFMWVVLVISLLNKEDRCGNAHMIYKRLEQLPAGLSDLIGELLGREPHNPYFRPLLQLMTFAYEDLHLCPRSIYSALILGVSVKGVDNTMNAQGLASRQTHEKFILDASKGLVEVVDHPARVQYVHESIRTFFLNEGLKYLAGDGDTEANKSKEGGNPGISNDQSTVLGTYCHDSLTQLCVKYVLAATQSGLATSEHMLAYQIRRIYHSDTEHEPFPFLKYAGEGLMRHAEDAWKARTQRSNRFEIIPGEALDLLYDSLGSSRRHRKIFLSSEPLFKMAYLLTAHGCPTLLRAVLESMPTSQRDMNTLMSISTHENIIGRRSMACMSVLLLFRGDPNCRDEHGVSSVNNAIKFGLWDVAKQLLEHGFRPYALTDGDHDELYAVCERGELASAQLLLGENLRADVHCQAYKNSLARALQKSRSRRDRALSLFLIKKGAEDGLWSLCWMPTSTGH